MIKEDPQPAEGAPELEPELEPVEPRAKSPWKAFILTGFLAGLIGAAGGGYGAYAALKKFSPAPQPQAKVDLSPIETKLTRLTERVTESEAAALEAASNPALEFEPVDMSVIKKRLTALEKIPAPDIDPDALTALQAAQKDGFEWPDTSLIEGRIAVLEAQAETSPDSATVSTALEERISELETQVETSAKLTASAPAVAVPNNLLKRLKTLEAEAEMFRNAEAVSALDDEKMTALEARLSALENRPAPSPVVKRVSILAFPKAQMVSAVEANMDGGLIKKTLSRHIRVKDDNDPLTLIEGIETDLSEGRLVAAAEKFERLPSPVRSAGQAWYESVKASL